MRTIWYMGVKTRLIEGFIDTALADCAGDGATLLDLASGTAAVSTALAPRFRIVANDVQRYAAAIARSYLVHDEATRRLLGELDVERDLGAAFRENWDALAEPLAGAIGVEDAFLRAHGLEPSTVDPGTSFREPEPPRLRAEPKLPREPARLASAYRVFALDATPRFEETHDPRATGPFEAARELFSRDTILARRDDTRARPFLLATSYYPNVYLGIRQAIAADSLRYAIDQLETRTMLGRAKRDHYLAALLHALSVSTSATSHFCQPRGLVRDVEVKAVLLRRAVSLASRVEAFSRDIATTVRAIAHRPRNVVVSGDWRELFTETGTGRDAWTIPEARADVVYLDPPYTGDNYSRFYHLLEVIADYDYPSLDVRRGRVMKGRYPARDRRHQSAFCRRSSVGRELEDLFAACARAGAACVVSYAEESGLLLRRWREDEGMSGDAALRRFIDLARSVYGDVELRTRRILHSGQGRLNEPATELLLVCRKPDPAAAARRRARRTRTCAT
jgi:adenine-specific DNA methylase